jgi:hypothetical protein
MRPHNMPVQRLKLAVLRLDLPCSGFLTHSGEILTTVKSHMQNPEGIWIVIVVDSSNCSEHGYVLCEVGNVCLYTACHFYLVTERGSFAA